MENFDLNNQESIAQYVLRNLRKHKLFALGTIDEQHKPWVVALNLSIDEKANIIWKSASATEHSKNILKNPHVSICIFSNDEKTGDFGFYAKATAQEVVSEEEIARFSKIRYKKEGKEVPPVSNYMHPAPDRIYYAEINEAWVNDPRHIKTEIDLDVLRDVARKENP